MRQVIQACFNIVVDARNALPKVAMKVDTLRDNKPDM